MLVTAATRAMKIRPWTVIHHARTSLSKPYFRTISAMRMNIATPAVMAAHLKKVSALATASGLVILVLTPVPSAGVVRGRQACRGWHRLHRRHGHRGGRVRRGKPHPRARPGPGLPPLRLQGGQPAAPRGV